MESERHGQRSEEVEPGNQEAEKVGSREGEIGRRHRLQPNLEDAGGIAAETEIGPIGAPPEVSCDIRLLSACPACMDTVRPSTCSLRERAQEEAIL
jgi:hypothetical protein